MKIQYLAIIFIIIIMPIIIVYSEYINNQITTIKTEGIYNERLLNSTYDAIKAYQLNTMSNVYSEKAEQAKKELEASAKTFLNSISTSFQYTGYKSEVINEYIPAIVYTMYDGYYIYQPLVNTLTNVNNDQVDEEYMDDSVIHELKPYVYYSCRYKPNATDDFTIVYSLDNYIAIEGFIGGEYVFEKGFLYETDEIENNETLTYLSTSDTIYYKGIEITRSDEEALSEYLGIENTKKYYYVKIDGQKFYYFGDATDGNIANTSENDYIFYINDKGEIFKQFENNDKKEGSKANFEIVYNTIFHNQKGFEYYREAYEFSKRINSLIGDLKPSDAVDEDGNKYSSDNSPFNNGMNYKIFDGNIESAKSNFNKHRTDVIRKVVQTNLATSISSFKKYCNLDTDVEFIMPKISETDWDQIENNICIITFLQGMPIGGKVYNSYAVVPNNLNKEYVDENDIYMLTNDNQYTKANDSNLAKGDKEIKNKSSLRYYPGVLKTNFVRKKSIKSDVVDPDSLGYYYPLKEMASYSGIVSSSSLNSLLYEDMYEYMSISNDQISMNVDNKKEYIKSYYIALGRERTGIYNVNNGLSDSDKKLSKKYQNGWFFSSNIAMADIEFTPSEMIYNESQTEYKPSVTLKFGNKVLTPGTDYIIEEYFDNNDAGIGHVRIKGLGLYAGTEVIGSFKIKAKDISEEVIVALENNNFVYDGTPKETDLTVSYHSQTIDKEKYSYVIEQDTNINAGAVNIQIESLDKNMRFSKTATFNINPKNISNPETAGLSVQLDTNVYNYDGTEKRPNLTIVDSIAHKELSLNRDYQLSYKDNIHVGEGKIIVKGKGNYIGEFTKSFTINGVEDNTPDLVISATPESFEYDGKSKIPSVTVLYKGRPLTKGQDYNIELPSDTTNIGTKIIKIHGINNFVGTEKIVNYSIEAAERKFEIIINESSGYFIYDGNPKTPRITVRVNGENVNENDIDVRYEDNTSIGQGKVIVSAKAGTNYAGMERTKVFSIFAKSIESTDIQKQLNINSYVYTGSENKPIPTLTNNGKTLVRDVDYSVTYKNNINAGTGIVKLHGLNNYTGDVELTFTINPKQITASMVTLQKDRVSYTSNEIDIGVVVKDTNSVVLVKDVDYTLTYENNYNAGQGKVIIGGKGNYSGQVEKTFTIESIEIVDSYVSVIDCEYSANEQRPNCTVTVGGNLFKLGIDYRVEYSNNINAGTGTAKIIGIGNCTGTVIKNFTIHKKEITDDMVILSESSFTYTGNSQKPSVTVLHYYVTEGMGGVGTVPEPRTLTTDDYTVSYSSDTTSTGTKEVTVTGKGNYTGTVKKNYTINKKSISDCTITLSGTSFDYTGSEIKPGVTVKDGNTTLVLNTDYTISYSNNINVTSATSKASVTITAKGNSYSGSETKYFTINAISEEKSLDGVLGRIGLRADAGYDVWSNACAKGTLTWNGSKVTGTIYGYAVKRDGNSLNGTVKDGAQINVTNSTAISIGKVDTYNNDSYDIGSTSVNTSTKKIEVWLTGGSYTTPEHTLSVEF